MRAAMGPQRAPSGPDRAQTAARAVLARTFGGAHLRPARLSPPSLHHSARCGRAHCSHRRLSDTVAAGHGAPRAAAQQTRHKRAPRVALAAARIGARARAQAARLCPSPCPARGEDRNSETQGRGRGGRDGGEILSRETIRNRGPKFRELFYDSDPFHTGSLGPEEVRTL